MRCALACVNCVLSFAAAPLRCKPHRACAPDTKKRPRFPGAARERLALELLLDHRLAVTALDDHGLVHAAVAMTPAFVAAAIAMHHDALHLDLRVLREGRRGESRRGERDGGGRCGRKSKNS